MVAVVRAEVEERDPVYMYYRERPQLRLIADMPESFSSSSEPVSARCSQSTYWRRRVACLACLLYTSPSPRDVEESRMPSSA